MAQGNRPDSSDCVILLIDNYDSFVHNLARYFVRLGQWTRVVRNDQVAVEDIRRMAPRAIVLSPGPCSPAEAGICVEVVRRLHDRTPILGVCLGHQAIAAAFGGSIVRAREPMHGRTSQVYHDGGGIFRGLPQPITACRYHSLVVSEAGLSDCLEVSAQTADGTVMGLRHRRTLTEGVQFHPESILTEHGYPMLAAFLRLAGLSVPEKLPSAHNEQNRGAVGELVP